MTAIKSHNRLINKLSFDLELSACILIIMQCVAYDHKLMQQSVIQWCISQVCISDHNIAYVLHKTHTDTLRHAWLGWSAFPDYHSVFPSSWAPMCSCEECTATACVFLDLFNVTPVEKHWTKYCSVVTQTSTMMTKLVFTGVLSRFINIAWQLKITLWEKGIRFVAMLPCEPKHAVSAAESASVRTCWQANQSNVLITQSLIKTLTRDWTSFNKALSCVMSVTEIVLQGIYRLIKITQRSVYHMLNVSYRVFNVK